MANRWLLFGTFAAFGMGSISAQQQLPAGPAKPTVARVCSGCHPAEIVIGREHTRDEWERVVGEMANAGAEGTDEEFIAIIDYLAKNFPKQPAGKINVNKASAAALATGLSLSAKEADAVVQYREQNGNFKTIEDLKKVAGLDFKKIEAKKDRLVF